MQTGQGASQGWRTFLRNHAPDIAAMDLFVVPTTGFDLLYAFVIVRLDRRDIVWINVTRHPTAEWIARQLTEAFPWDKAPRYLIRDRDHIYGDIVTRRLCAIRDKPTAPASPWQNSFAERLIGSIRREYADHIVVLSKAHLHRIGHMKAEGHLGRCCLKGTAGDAANAILTAVGHNLRLVLAWIRILLRLILAALQSTITLPL